MVACYLYQGITYLFCVDTRFNRIIASKANFILHWICTLWLQTSGYWRERALVSSHSQHARISLFVLFSLRIIRASDLISSRLLKTISFLDHVPGLLGELRHVVPRQQHFTGTARVVHKRQQHDWQSDLYLQLPGSLATILCIISTKKKCQSFHDNFSLCI